MIMKPWKLWLHSRSGVVKKSSAKEKRSIPAPGTIRQGWVEVHSDRERPRWWEHNGPPLPGPLLPQWEEREKNRRPIFFTASQGTEGSQWQRLRQKTRVARNLCRQAIGVAAAETAALRADSSAGTGLRALPFAEADGAHGVPRPTTRLLWCILRVRCQWRVF